MGIAASKAELRRRLISARASMSQDSLVSAAQSLQAQLSTFIRGYAGNPGHQTPEPSSSGLVVGAYQPIGTEPGGRDLPQVLRAAGARVLLPVLLPDMDLDWAEFTGDLLAAGRGLLEPPGPRLGVTEIARADVILVPALAADRNGNRLGKGGGSYDRALARAPESALVVALLHDGELLDEVPAEPHDRPVDAVATPTGITPLR